MGFRELGLEIDYTGRGDDILTGFVLPVLGEATAYDRVTSFFTTDSLVAIAEGLDRLWERRGRMRLVLGLHDVPADLAEAALEMEDPIDVVISQVRERILSGIAQLSDELSKDRLTAIAWMMQDGLLEVRVAAPDSFDGHRSGIFHNKVFIFKDDQNDVVAAVGSPNETAAGLGSNFEHLTAFVSWEQPRYTAAQTLFFEGLWQNHQPGLSVRALDPAFADEILRALGRTRPPAPPYGAEEGPKMRAYLDAAARMPALAMVAGGHTALFAHQELAFLDALSRWPVRVLLADEVGLGKTFEAGSVLRYLLESTSATRALILAPKAVVYQWQAELDEHFGLDAWVYDSGRRSFLSPTGEVRVLAPSEPVLGDSTPAVVIMSAQLARGSRRGGSIFEGDTRMPDVLVVDEAHAARVRPVLGGAERPTRMWRLLQAIMPKIPHVVFATATPMQVDWREYHALLELLGLPGVWRKPENYRSSLELVTLDASPTLRDAGLAVRLIRDAMNGYRPRSLRLDADESALLNEVAGPAAESEVLAATAVMGNWPVARRVLVKTHPAHLMTVRNTRTALEAIGYRFPERLLPLVSLNVPNDVRAFYKQVDTYLSEAYFELERALFPKKKFSIGFVKCSYQQRLASSLSACQRSLMRRHERVAAAITNPTGIATMESETDELLDSDLMEEATGLDAAVLDAEVVDMGEVRRAARIELEYLKDLIRVVNRILGGGPDPKFARAVELLLEHLDCGDSVLVFSRYTDTLDAMVAAFRTATVSSFEPYAVYSGQAAQVDCGGGPLQSTRGGIREALDSGAVRVIFCSDAASEGLNLQTASVIINVDVPWNPARLEQRIGRIARLGQKAPTVSIYNLWYPDSIEAKIYKRLMDRADLYSVAVGEFPEVVGAAIRSEVAARFGGPPSDTDAVAELNRLKNDVQVAALRSLWVRGGAPTTLTNLFRDELSSLAQSAAQLADASVSTIAGITALSQDGVGEFSYTTEPGSDRVISVRHPAMEWFSRREASEDGLEVTVLSSDVGPAFFAVGGQPVDPTRVPALLSALALPGAVAEGIRLLHPDDSGRLRCDWLPRPQDLTIPAELDCSVPEVPDISLPSLRNTSITHVRDLTCE